MDKNGLSQVWVLKALVEFHEENHTVWLCDELCTGTIRQCMDHAATLVPTYRRLELTLNSIAEAWDKIFRQNLSSEWLDGKRKYFYIERLESRRC